MINYDNMMTTVLAWVQANPGFPIHLTDRQLLHAFANHGELEEWAQKNNVTLRRGGAGWHLKIELNS